MILLETLHTIPLNDLREHEASSDCWCKPTLDDEASGLLYIHHALDQREAVEEGRRLIQ